jgi:hypothetical protein
MRRNQTSSSAWCWEIIIVCSEQFKQSDVSEGSSTLFFKVWYILEWPESAAQSATGGSAVRISLYRGLCSMLQQALSSFSWILLSIFYSIHPLLSPLLPLLWSDFCHPLLQPLAVFYSRTNGSWLLLFKYICPTIAQYMLTVSVSCNTATCFGVHTSSSGSFLLLMRKLQIYIYLYIYKYIYIYLYKYIYILIYTRWYMVIKQKW